MDASTLAAWWGAATGTFAVLWEVFRWLNEGPKLRISASTNMQIIQPGVGVQPEKLVSVTVRNVGTSATTITHLCGCIYKGWFARLRKRPASLFVITTGPESPVPFKLEPGCTWSGTALQSQLEEAMTKSGAYLYIGVQHSMAERPEFTRVGLSVSKG